MCWKEEWAFAIDFINKAIAHVEKAEKKIQDRRIRAQRWYVRLSMDKKHGTPSELAKVQTIIKKWAEAEQECYNVIERLRCEQRVLRDLIENYGFNRKHSGSARVRKILEKTFKEAS